MTQLPRPLPDAKVKDLPKWSIWNRFLGQPTWLKIAAGIGLGLLVLAPILYFALRGKPTVLVIYGDVDIRDVNLGFRVPGRIETVLKDEGDSVSQGELGGDRKYGTQSTSAVAHKPGAIVVGRNANRRPAISVCDHVFSVAGVIM